MADQTNRVAKLEVAAQTDVARFGGFLELAPDAIVIVNRGGQIVFVNARAELMFGYRRTEVLGETVEILLPERFRDNHLGHRVAYNDHPRTRPMGAGLDLIGRRKDGTEFPVEVSLSPMEQEGDLFVMSVIRDVTERKRMEATLRESEERFRLLVEKVRDYAIFMLDPDGRVASWNVGAERIEGYRAEEIIGQHFSRFYTPEDIERGKPDDELRRAALNGQIEDESWHVRKDGRRFWANTVITALRDETGTLRGFANVTRDITDRMQAEERLKQQAEELARSNAELQQFAYVASHDLQEPLRKIQAFGDRLKNKCGDALNDDGRDYLMRMQNAASRMQTLIHDLLALSRVASRPNPFSPVDLSAVAWDVVSDLESRIEQLGGRVEIGPLPVVLADRIQVSQLLQNLIGNALKFHRPGYPPLVQVRAEVERHVEFDRPLCRLTVQDNGIGFDEKYRERIFQIFQRLHGRAEYDGSGIGLAICRKIAERHGGSITAESVPGTGSKFIVTLPCVPSAADTGEQGNG